MPFFISPSYSSHPVTLDDLPFTNAYKETHDEIENRKIFRNILYYADANEEKKNKSLYYGFFKPCLEELCGVEKHGELFTMLEHYLGAVKIFGGEDMNEGIDEMLLSIHCRACPNRVLLVRVCKC